MFCVVRGYAYQVAAAALAWLDLDAMGKVYLEVAEDYAIVAQHSLDAVQVKDTAESGSVTLNTKAVREAIERNTPEAGLDRLHTFVIKYVRTLCEQAGVAVTRDKALHSLFGEYVKKLQASGKIESEMTMRILKSSISVLEAFNDVRNNQSLAHDNPVLNYEEALLIFNHVAGLVRFLRNFERKA